MIIWFTAAPIVQFSSMLNTLIKERKMIHTGNLSYLNKVHRQYGVWKYNMYLLRQWSDGKMTVQFKEKEDETKT
jgi:hypothetical protein